MSEMLMQDALRLRRAGRLAEAADIYAQVLNGEPKHFEALHALGIVRYQAGQLEEAERLIGEAIEIRPGAADANYNRACLLQKLHRPGDALAAFNHAIQLKPDYLEALVNRGSLLMSLQRYDEALADLDKAAALRPNVPQVWSNRGATLLKLQRSADAILSSDKALALNPNLADAWNNRGTALLLEWRFADALESFDHALKLDSANAGALAGRGHALAELNRREEAIATYDKALAIDPKSAHSLYHRGNAQFASKDFEAAATDYRRTIELNSDYPYARGLAIFSALCCCDWKGLEAARTAALGELHAGKPAVAPFECIAMTDEPADVLSAARVWSNDRYGKLPEPLWRGERYRHDRIRVAYLSANFHDHAVSRLMAGVWESHDRARFETTGISFGPVDASAMRARAAAAFERFADVRERSDGDIAAMLHGMEIDIAVDLMGYTEHSRAGILRFRPAPVQVNFIGYPGTMGAAHVDYILGDAFVIPKAHKPHYTEEVIYLPDAYLPNDAKRAISERMVSRAEAGLPQKSFVFASFNNTYKFTQAMFDVWMRLLAGVEGSVLWLPQGNSPARANLCREAEARGISRERIIFAPYIASDESHLARLRLADLFLDTLPYNAHAGACDALWAGVPVVTCSGKTFAGRVGTSVLQAVGLPELSTPSLEAYEALALKLARDPQMLAAIRAKLARNLKTEPLFDTERFTRNLEAAFVAMWERAQDTHLSAPSASGAGA